MQIQTTPQNQVAVVVPVYRNKISADEKIALNHAVNYLDGYPRFLLLPEELHFALKGFTTVLFDSRFFHDVVSYSQLLLSKAFYETFKNYEYILIYQLDCLLFSDQLDIWCKAGYD